MNLLSSDKKSNNNPGLSELRDYIIKEIQAIYEYQESQAITYRLFEDIAGIQRKDITLYPDRKMEVAAQKHLMEAVASIMKHKPLQYVTGFAWFYDLKFIVNEKVLIPRRETEELVQWIISEQKERNGLRILDIGTGSACIAITLALNLSGPEVLALDFAPEALEVAALNASKLKADIKTFRADILNPELKTKPDIFDIIVSNPPYVRESEKLAMQPNVLDYEPVQALFVKDEDPLIFYRAIAAFAARHLAEGGIVYVEINENLGAETLELFSEFGFKDVLLKKDMQGKDRMIKARRVS